MWHACRCVSSPRASSRVEEMSRDSKRQNYAVMQAGLTTIAERYPAPLPLHSQTLCHRRSHRLALHTCPSYQEGPCIVVQRISPISLRPLSSAATGGYFSLVSPSATLLVSVNMWTGQQRRRHKSSSGTASKDQILRQEEAKGAGVRPSGGSGNRSREAGRRWQGRRGRLRGQVSHLLGGRDRGERAHTFCSCQFYSRYRRQREGPRNFAA